MRRTYHSLQNAIAPVRPTAHIGASRAGIDGCLLQLKHTAAQVLAAGLDASIAKIGSQRIAEPNLED